MEYEKVPFDARRLSTSRISDLQLLVAACIREQQSLEINLRFDGQESYLVVTKKDAKRPIEKTHQLDRLSRRVGKTVIELEDLLQLNQAQRKHAREGTFRPYRKTLKRIASVLNLKTNDIDILTLARPTR